MDVTANEPYAVVCVQNQKTTNLSQSALKQWHLLRKKKPIVNDNIWCFTQSGYKTYHKYYLQQQVVSYSILNEPFPAAVREK